MSSEAQVLAAVQEDIGALKIANAVTQSKLDDIRVSLENLHNRPPPGVPVWLLVLLAVPPLITSLALLVLVAVNGLGR